MLDYESLAAETRALVDRCKDSGLMHATMAFRRQAETMVQGKHVVSFTNCSYLGYDTEPAVIAAAQELLGEWGTHVCCARSRLSIEPLTRLEARLSALFGAPAITFPSVTSTHAAVLPLVASGLLLGDDKNAPRPKLVFDRFSHASMQVLKPIMRETADVVTVGHNDVAAVAAEARKSREIGQSCVFLCDSVYSMGGVAPMAELLRLSQEEGLFLYVDDAHGTSIFGERGQGYVSEMLAGVWPERLFATFSLAKGFGCNGGGVVLPHERSEELVRYYGQTYAFSGPLDFAIVGAALKVLEEHESGAVRLRQGALRGKVALVDALLSPGGPAQPFSPIRMLTVGDERRAVTIGERLLDQGFYVPVVFYPVVPRGRAQLRLCITVAHSDDVLRKLCATLLELGLDLHGNVSQPVATPGRGRTPGARARELD